VGPSSSKGATDSGGGGDHSERATPSLDVDDASSVLSFSSGRRLLISRTFRDEGGREYVRHEVVKNQGVIDAYVRIMSGSKDKDIRMEFAEKDEKTREDMRKEVKRLQSAIRQLDRAEERAKQKPQKPKKNKEFTAMHLTCSACGQKGHMKTNKNCPKYKNQPVQVAPTDDELAAATSEVPLVQDDLVKVEGTKVVLKKDLLEHAEDVRRRSLVLKFPKEKIRKRKKQGDEQLDYLENIRKHKYETRQQFTEHVNLIVNNCITYNGFNSELTKTAQRMLEMSNKEINQNSQALEKLEHEINPLLGDDPQAALSFLCRKSIERMKAVPNSWPFHFPVSSKKLPDYRMIITKPMDLQTMRKKCEADSYRSREEFLVDLNQIVDNSITYNGPTSPFTVTAQSMREVGLQYLEEEREHFEQYESQLGPFDKSPLNEPEGLGGESGDEEAEEEDTSTNMNITGQSSVIITSEDSIQIGTIDVEGTDEEDIEKGRKGEGLIASSLLPVTGGGMDILSHDLQYSSSSSSEGEGEEEDITDMEEV
uniref:Bromo domain-containing protein n=1 Tax=Amphimedon queenslandica TaxID=400682 RepID=A0A1X7TDZ3_AMPQE